MNKKQKYAIIFLICFIITTILVFTDNLIIMDDKIYNFIIAFRSVFLDFFYRNITKICNPISVTAISIFILLFLKKDDRLFFGINTLCTLFTNQIIKRIIRRPRPNHLRLIRESGFSYPSGHAMISIAIFGFLIYLTIKKVNNKYLKITIVTLINLLIILIGISRIYLGVHYPTDVISGYLLSISIIITMKNYYKKFLGGIKNVKNGIK